MSDKEVHFIFVELLASMSASAIKELRSRFTGQSELISRPFDRVMPLDPWGKNRTLLIGSAAHAASAYMGMGGEMTPENAAVLDQCISAAATLHTVMECRFERVKLVVETSMRLGELEQEKAPPSESRTLLTKALITLGYPN